MASKKRPVQEEIPMEGAGVAPVQDKKLDGLCDQFIELRDHKSELAEGLTAAETKILDRMNELGITVHRFSDQIASIKAGKNHVKIKTVKADSSGDGSRNADDADSE